MNGIEQVHKVQTIQDFPERGNVTVYAKSVMHEKAPLQPKKFNRAELKVHWIILQPAD